MKKLFREPLLHFFVLGAGLFLVHGWLAGTGSYAKDSLVISRGQVQHLAAGFASVHQRAPSRHELDGLVTDAVREEIFYREALAQGLDRDDIIVRRRLMQKLEFVAQDIDPVPPPTQAQLLDYLALHPEKFQVEPHYAFRHVYLNPQQRGDALQADASRLLAQLRQGGPDAGGDAFLLGHRFDSIGAGEVLRVFGAGFAGEMETLATGAWNGPVTSGFGVHLVWLEKRDEGRQATLAEVRDQVAREWQYEQQQAANARFYDGLRARYHIEIDMPDAATDASNLVAELQR